MKHRRKSPTPQGLLALLLAVLLAAAAGAQPTNVAMSDKQRADRLLTVDCLLPGQVRQMGSRMTYLTQGRAIKTSAGDCEIRGGEYVAYDRASYATALKVWQSGADAGDKEAQTNVGEIYERGVGGPPDYAKAAFWYRKAADQGYGRALINLGFLYEQGRGVPVDPVAALKLYRQAAGLTGSVSLDAPPAAAAPAVSAAELNALRNELERTRRELDKARQELDQQRLKSSKEIERITQQKIAATAAGNADESRRLEAQLKERESELEQRRTQVARFEQTNEEFKAKLSRMESESAGMRKELESSRYQLAQSQRELDERKKAATQQERDVAAARAELDRQKQAGAAADATRTRTLEAELAKRSDELKRQTSEIARLEKELSGSKNQLAKMETVKPAATFPGVDIAPPSIQILDPSIVITRDTALAKVRSGLSTRPVVGRVIAPAGLLSLTANDTAQPVDAEGFFTTNVALGQGKTKVTMIAIDRQSKRAVLEFFLESDAAAAPTAIARPQPSAINLGNYYALLIGNQKYEKLRSLNSPETDVTVIEKLLRDRYGFKVTTLINATRYQMLSELTKLTETLTEKDNLLIYYAGHGEIDPATQSASWLPVDAEPKNDANWISSDDLTRKIGPMKARHVLVVADSCYSGVLTRSGTSQVPSGATDDERFEWYKSVSAKRSRHLLSSGGRAPVMDGGGGKHSVFAAVFIEALQVNDDILDGRRLGDAISTRVLRKSKPYMKDGQLPEYRPIQFADNEGGEFLFPRPKASTEKTSLRDAPPAYVAQLMPAR